MRYEYDGTADALYVTLSDEPVQRQVRLDDGTIIDVGQSETVVGVEVLVPSSPWHPDTLGKRWSLAVEELTLLRLLAQSFRRQPVGCAAGGGDHVTDNVRLAA